MKTAKTKPPKSASASALLIAVILTSLLAIIGVMFVMIARVDKMSTSSISQNKELNFAVETIVAKISQELVLDTPGVARAAYYDYPDADNAWLASLEPYQSGTDYYWRHISDIYNRFGTVDSGLKAEIKPDYQSSSEIGDSNNIIGYPADADGDGVADSNWVKVNDINSNRGKPIFAAVRIIDNGAMINVNTAYQFDPNATPAEANLIDGSSQMQINLLALAGRDNIHTAPGEKENRLLSFRCGSEPSDMAEYKQNVVWCYNEPNGAYTPFDISDELKLRNRYILNYNLMTSRIEELWTWCYYGGPNVPCTDPVKFAADNDYWFFRTYNGSADPCIYDYRHISTTYNMDRIIAPDGSKMTNINDANAAELYNAIRKGLQDANYPDVNMAAQLAVNLIDYRDGDSNVSTIDVNGIRYYGFETQPFISEIAAYIDKLDANKPNKNSYALELYNPFNKAVSLGGFVLSIDNKPTNTNIATIDLNGFSIDANGFFVIYNDLGSKFTINTSNKKPDNSLVFSGNYVDNPPQDGIFDSWDNYSITLKRIVDANNIILDTNNTINAWFTPNNSTVFAQRDTKDWHVVYQTMETNQPGSLGSLNTASITGKNYNLSLANDRFVTVGDVARVLTVGPSLNQNDAIGARLASEPNENLVRLDLQNAAFQQIFKYLTVIDPNDHITDPNELMGNETKIKGRININTAPWYVLAQLPWVSQRVKYSDPALAQAIVKYRDEDKTPKGFGNIGELMNVPGIDYYSTTQSGDLTTFPDLTPGDNAPDDFEERDVIFSRISNLVTVRSDVFTAYILVRIGTDGPQKRVMAILDRSNVRSANDKVRIIALHPVPDPR